MKREILFEDLEESGRALARSLQHYRDNGNVVVVGIARGGIPVAREVAAALHAPLELAVRRSFFIRGIDDAIGVVNVAGTEVIDAGGEPVHAPSTPEQWFITASLRSFRERVAECRGQALPFELSGRTVIVVDNSIRSTLTVRTTVRAVRSLCPARVVVAVPLCAADASEAASELADDFIALARPAVFGHAGLFYRQLNVPDEQTIRSTFLNFRASV